MTSTTRSSGARHRRTSTPQKIMSAGLATATCVGVVGLVGVRTVDVNASSQSPALQNAVQPLGAVAGVADVAVTSSTGGLSVEQLDAYAAQLTAEKARLDDYRAKLVRTAKRLQRITARQAAAGPRPVRGASSAQPNVVSSPPRIAVRPKSKPAPKAAHVARSVPAPKTHSNTKSS